MTDTEFIKFPKIARLSRPMTITEKVDGTNAQIYISEDRKELRAGSRNRFLTLENDNYGFAAWAEEHKQELIDGLGPGRHYGEWAGKGIQRSYGTHLRKFFLFNVHRWNNKSKPACCDVVPVLLSGAVILMSDEDDWKNDITNWTTYCLAFLQKHGSQAFPRFMKPEGIVVHSEAANVMFKKTFENDMAGKFNQ